MVRHFAPLSAGFAHHKLSIDNLSVQRRCFVLASNRKRQFQICGIASLLFFMTSAGGSLSVYPLTVLFWIHRDLRYCRSITCFQVVHRELTCWTDGFSSLCCISRSNCCNTRHAPFASSVSRPRSADRFLFPRQAETALWLRAPLIDCRPSIRTHRSGDC